MENTLAQLKEWLETPRRIAITTHQKPDGDAMGSSLALYHYLVQCGHRVTVVTPTDYAENLKWLQGTDQVVIGPQDFDGAKWIFEGADVIFCLDFNSLTRLNEFGKVVGESDAKKVMVDHHLEPDEFYDWKYWDATASSTAELVYRLIMEWDDEDKISQAVAESIYCGVLTDTGSFRFSSTTPAVHEMTANLLRKGVDTTRVHDQIYSNSSENRLRFLGHCLNNCLYILPELKTAYIKVDKSVFKNFFIKPGDTEGLVNYALGIRGINLGVLLTTQDDIVKLSFRSRNGVSSNELAKHFGGGGHFYASGGKSTDSLEDTEKKFLDLVEANKEKITV